MGFSKSEFPVGEVIYLDHGQCKTFEVSYFGNGSFFAIASEVLSSKDYDDRSVETLESAGSNVLIFARVEKSPPGWYTILAYAG